MVVVSLNCACFIGRLIVWCPLLCVAGFCEICCQILAECFPNRWGLRWSEPFLHLSACLLFRRWQRRLPRCKWWNLSWPLSLLGYTVICLCLVSCCRWRRLSFDTEYSSDIEKDLLIWCSCQVWVKPLFSWLWQTVYAGMVMLRREDGHALRRALDCEVEGHGEKSRPKTIWKQLGEGESVMVGLRIWSVGVNQFAAGLRWCWPPSLVGDTPRMWSVGVNQVSAGLMWCWPPPFLLGILPECGVSALISLLLAWGDADPLHLLGILPECGVSVLISFLLAWGDAGPPLTCWGYSQNVECRR